MSPLTVVIPAHDEETVDLSQPSKIAAVREGIRRADGDVVVLDAEIELTTAGVRALAETLDRDDPVRNGPGAERDGAGSPRTRRGHVDDRLGGTPVVGTVDRSGPVGPALTTFRAAARR